MQNVQPVDSETALVVSRTIPAPPDQVFNAFTQASILQQWMGPGDVECIACEVDLTVGGSYRIHMRSSDGDHVALGEYVEIVPNQKIVFTWSWESGFVTNSLVTVTLSPRDGGTHVELLHEKLPDADTTGKHAHGWEGCLAKLLTLY